MNKKDMLKLQCRTDLAIEAVEQLVGEVDSPNKNGVKYVEDVVNGVKITCIDVDKVAEENVGKKAGRYMTVNTGSVISHDHDQLTVAMEVFTHQFKELLAHRNITPEMTCLVIGLGNDHVTPDALGPMVVDEVIVTRHLYQLRPDEVDRNYRVVSALAPGVMGMTGIETYDVIESLVKKTTPDFLVVVDALASRSITRVNKMIQMTDTGIAPGSGVGNKRRAINEESLGIPVFAIGVPTVVDAVSVTSDTIDLLLKHIGKSLKEETRSYKKLVPFGGAARQNYSEEDLPSDELKQQFMGHIGMLSEEEKRQLLSEVLTPNGFNLIVTPKEIDTEIESLATLISNGINRALHQNIQFS
ncbi:MAG TPA: GPR endopeptidase [Firmicutes bacterium]|nr:GPR endopeptidase [Bacillota bacterium]